MIPGRPRPESAQKKEKHRRGGEARESARARRTTCLIAFGINVSFEAVNLIVKNGQFEMKPYLQLFLHNLI